MPPLTQDLSKTLIARLRQADTFQHYVQSFEKVTGLPLSLCSLHHWPPAVRGADCENLFCAAMLRSGRSCTACLEVKRAIEGNAVGEPRSVTCLAGICDTGVPVRMDERLIGFLVVGPVLLAPPSEKQFARTLGLLKRSGVNLHRDEFAASYFAIPTLSPEQHAPIVQMLIVFAEHLSMLASQALLREQHAEPPPVVRARQFIQEHHAKPLRLAEVARSARLSTTYFSRMFKKSTALSFSEYLARVRVEQAKHLLLNPNMQVSEVAFAVGFQSVPHFNRVFRRVHGEAPGIYRQRNAIT
ncbi:MAG: helix-turn-helix domain-containing protein [Chthoniobacteraceae bacterium]